MPHYSFILGELEQRNLKKKKDRCPFEGNLESIKRESFGLEDVEIYGPIRCTWLSLRSF